MYRVEYISRGSRSWIGGGMFSSEQSAITNARSVAGRANVETVRVLDPDGHPVWFS